MSWTKEETFALFQLIGVVVSLVLLTTFVYFAWGVVFEWLDYDPKYEHDAATSRIMHSCRQLDSDAVLDCLYEAGVELRLREPTEIKGW